MKEELGFYSEFTFGRLDVAGDEQYGFRPFQLMVSAIAVCSGGVLRKVLKKMRLPFEDITIQAEVERNENEADRIERIHLHFQIIASEELNEAKVNRALELTRKNCSMVRSVEGSIDIKETFEVMCK